jgi:hypothetical protein
LIKFLLFLSALGVIFIILIKIIDKLWPEE